MQFVYKSAGGEQLDVIMIAVEGVPPLGRKKILIPLESYIAADAGAQAIIADTHPLLIKMLQYGGKQLEIPFSWNNMAMYYNTQIFKDKGVDAPKPAWTWDDFLATCLKVANVKGTADDLYAYSFWGAGMFGMCAWYFVNNTSPLTDDWKNSNMLDPKVAETLQFLADLILKHISVTAWVEALLHMLEDSFASQNAPIAHIKVQMSTPTTAVKASLSQAGVAISWDVWAEDAATGQAQFIVNARVNTDPQTLGQAVRRAIEALTPRPEFRCDFTHFECFSPLPPQPTHRLGPAPAFPL